MIIAIIIGVDNKNSAWMSLPPPPPPPPPPSSYDAGSLYDISVGAAAGVLLHLRHRRVVIIGRGGGDASNINLHVSSLWWILKMYCMFFKEAVHYNAGYQIRQSNLMCSIGLIFVSAMSDGYDIVSITLWKGWWWCVFCECECEVRGGCDALSLCGCGASTWMEATSPPTLLWRLFLRTFPLTYYIGITCPTIVEECYTTYGELRELECGTPL